MWKNKEDDGAGELGLESQTKEKHKLDEKVHRLQMYGQSLMLCGILRVPWETVFPVAVIGPKWLRSNPSSHNKIG